MMGKLYFYVCWLLWCATGLLDIFYDDLPYPVEITQNDCKWTSLSAGLANWLMDEMHFPVDSGNLSDVDMRKLYATREDLGDGLVFRWLSQLRAHARSAHEKFPVMPEESYWYFHNCRWILKVLAEYDNVLSEFESTMFYDRYQENIGVFAELIELLSTEHPQITTQGNIDEENTQALQAEIETIATNMATEWRQAVHLAASDLDRLQSLLSEKSHQEELFS